MVVAAPADAPPLVRMQGANYATAIAEHFRDRRLDVLLLMDSLTRYAMAQREIALAIGEPPPPRATRRAASLKLPQLVERSGNGVAGGGSITAFYTVLARATTPTTRSPTRRAASLDGHIVLTRELAEGRPLPGHRRGEIGLARDGQRGARSRTSEAARRCASCWPASTRHAT